MFIHLKHFLYNHCCVVASEVPMTSIKWCLHVHIPVSRTHHIHMTYLHIRDTCCNYVYTCKKKVKKRRRIYIALYYKLLISKALRYGPRVTKGSHSFTCHQHTNHTCLYFPTARHHRPLAGTHCAYPRRDDQAELTWVAGHIPR